MTVLGVPLLSLVLFGSSALFVVLGVNAYRRPEVPTSRWFIALMIVEFAWTTSYGLKLATPDPGLHYSLDAVAETVAVCVPIVGLFFFLKFSGQDRYISPATVLLSLVLPFLSVVSYATNPVTGWAYESYRLHSAGVVTTLVGDPGLGAITAAILALLLTGVSAVVLFWTVFRYQSLYRHHIPWLVGLYAVTIGAFAAYRFGYTPIPGLRLIPFTGPLQAVIFGNLIFRYDFMTVSARTRRLGREAAMQSLQDGVVTLDDRRRIIDWNGFAADVLDLPREPLGRSIEEFDDGAVIEAAIDGDTPEFSDGDGRYIEASASSVVDQRGVTAGYVVLLRDVTDLKRREQRLSVLNRVLRHNIRNEMTVVKGQAERILDGADVPLEELARPISRSADDIVDLGEKARRLERMLGRERAYEATDGRAIAEAVADSVRATYPEMSITVEGDAATIETQPDVLETALHAAVENAAEHNTAANPTVRLEVAGTEDGLRIVVRDNGPGIPEPELEVLTAERETALQHGSGLGIWLIQWGIERLGGSVDFGDAPTGGAQVTLTVPDLRDGEGPELDPTVDIDSGIHRG